MGCHKHLQRAEWQFDPHYSSTSECPLDPLSVTACEVPSPHHVRLPAVVPAPLLPNLPRRDLFCALLHPYVQGKGLSILSAWKAKGIEMKNMVVKIK